MTRNIRRNESKQTKHKNTKRSIKKKNKDRAGYRKIGKILSTDHESESLSFCLPGTAETDAVQALLARYLQRRLQGSQLSTPPPPSVLFSNDHRARVRQVAQQRSLTDNTLSRNVNGKDDQNPVSEDYDDYEDDLQGYEDSERSRTRFDLLAGKSRLTLKSITAIGRKFIIPFDTFSWNTLINDRCFPALFVDYFPFYDKRDSVVIRIRNEK